MWWDITYLPENIQLFSSILTLISRNLVGPDVKIRIIVPFVLYGFLFCGTDLKYEYIKCIPIY